MQEKLQNLPDMQGLCRTAQQKKNDLEPHRARAVEIHGGETDGSAA